MYYSFDHFLHISFIQVEFFYVYELLIKFYIFLKRVGFFKICLNQITDCTCINNSRIFLKLFLDRRKNIQSTVSFSFNFALF